MNMLFVTSTNLSVSLDTSCSFTETPPKSNVVVETTECYRGRGEGYRGTVDMTPTGLTCQRWDSQYPHNHTLLPQAYPCKWVRHSLTHPPACTYTQAHYRKTFSVLSRDLRENYCRNPDGQEFPWCFTTDPRVRMMFCTNIPQCGTQNKPVSGERFNSFIQHSKQKGKSWFSSKSQAACSTASAFSSFVGHWVHMGPCNHTYWFVTMFAMSQWRTTAL